MTEPDTIAYYSIYTDDGNCIVAHSTERITEENSPTFGPALELLLNKHGYNLSQVVKLVYEFGSN